MTAVLLIASIGLVAFGYCMMARIDRFFATGGFADSGYAAPEESAHLVLLFGERERTGRFYRLPRVRGIVVRATDLSAIASEPPFAALAAVSRSDLDNLTLCRQAGRLCPGAALLARCSDPVYQPLYRDAGVACILPGEQNDDELRASVERWIAGECA